MNQPRLVAPPSSARGSSCSSLGIPRFPVVFVCFIDPEDQGFVRMGYLTDTTSAQLVLRVCPGPGCFNGGWSVNGGAFVMVRGLPPPFQHLISACACSTVAQCPRACRWHRLSFPWILTSSTSEGAPPCPLPSVGLSSWPVSWPLPPRLVHLQPFQWYGTCRGPKGCVCAVQELSPNPSQCPALARNRKEGLWPAQGSQSRAGAVQPRCTQRQRACRSDGLFGSVSR